MEKADEEQRLSIDTSAVQAALEKLREHPEPEAGAAAGIAVSLAAGRLVKGLLYGVPTYDTATFTIALALLAGAAAVAGYLPARRAARMDPMVALRNE